MMPNKRSFLALQEFLNVFQGAGGGKAGLEAVRGEFKRNFNVLSKQQEDEDLRIQLESKASKGARVNARIEEIADRALTRVVPALEKLEEPALWLAEKFGELAQWVAEHPAKAILLGLAGATMRAAIESSFRAAIEASIYRGTGAIVTASGPTAAGLGAVGTQAGFASAGLASVAAKAGVFLAATAAIYLALDQAEGLLDQLRKLSGDLGKGDKDTPPEDPDSPVAKARAKAKKPYERIAERIETAGQTVIGSAMMAGPGGGGFAGAALSRAIGEIEGMRAARRAVGEGKRSRDPRSRFFDVTQTAASTEDVMAKIDPMNWPKPQKDELGPKLDALKARLDKGIRITNPEDFKTATPGPGVDNSARSLQ
jgi:hypothetical protein